MQVIGAIIGTVIFVIGIGVGMETTRAGSVPQPLLVLVLGDWGRRGENNQKGTADAMGRVASKVSRKHSTAPQR